MIQALTAPARAATGKISMAPTLNSLLLLAEGSSLAITGTDLDLVFRTTSPAQVLDSGRSLIPARVAIDIFRSLPANHEIELTGDDRTIIIRSERTAYTLQTLPVDDYPPVPNPTGLIGSLEKEVLLSAIGKVSQAASHDDSRPILTGIYLHTHDNRTCLVATDSYRLAIAELDVPGETLMPPLLLPARSYSELARALSSYDSRSTGEEKSSDTITVSLDDQTVKFSSNEFDMVTRTISGNFPDYTRLIPSNSATTVTVDREGLCQALQRIRVLVNDASLSVKISSADSLLNLSLNATDVGTVEESLDATVEGEPVDLMFNPTYLLQGLESIDDSQAILLINDASTPILMKSPSDHTYRYLLMPIKLR